MGETTAQEYSFKFAVETGIWQWAGKWNLDPSLGLSNWRDSPS